MDSAAKIIMPHENDTENEKPDQKVDIVFENIHYAVSVPV